MHPIRNVTRFFIKTNTQKRKRKKKNERKSLPTNQQETQFNKTISSCWPCQMWQAIYIHTQILLLWIIKKNFYSEITNILRSHHAATIHLCAIIVCCISISKCKTLKLLSSSEFGSSNRRIRFSLQLGVSLLIDLLVIFVFVLFCFG